MGSDNSKRLSRAASGVAIALGMSALLGWIFDVAILKSVLPGLVTMKVNTAISFVLAGVSLWLQIEPASARPRRWPARVCALLVLALGILTLAEYVLGIDMGIDQLLLRTPAGELQTSSPGRMAPNTAFSFVLVGAALVLLDMNNRALQAMTQAVSVAALFISLVSSVGYAFSTVTFYRIAGYTAMSIHTAFGFAVLSIGVLASRRRARLLRFLDWPLRAKMAALLMVVSVAPLTFAAIVDIQAAAKKLEEMTNALLSARADQLRGEIDGFNRSHRLSVDQLARAVATVGCCHDFDEERIRAVRAILATRPASNSDVTTAAILDLSGRVRLATDPRIEGLDLSSRGHVREALRGVPVISNVHVAGAEAAEQPAIAYLAAVRRPGGALEGVAVIWIRATAVWDIMKKSNERGGPGSFAVLFDHQGIRIAHSFSRQIVFHPGGALSRDAIRAAVVERRFGDRTKALLEDVRSFPEQFERARADSPDGQMFSGIAPVSHKVNYGVARRLETVRWTMFYMIPEESLRAQVVQATRDRSFFAGVVIAFSLVAGALLAAIVVAPITSLSNATRRLAGGDPNARAMVLHADEIGELGESFNRMADRIESQTAALRQSNSELEERVLQRTAELTQSERSLSITLDSIGDAVIATDEAGRVVQMNPVAEQLTGWSIAAAKSKPLEEIFLIIDEDTRAVVRSPVERVLREEVIVGLTDHTILVARNGSECPIAENAAPIVHSDGSIRGVVLVFRDVRTDRAAQNALRASDAKYRDLYENLPDMCATVDVQSETVAECNATLAKELGYSKDEIIGRPMRDFYHLDVVHNGEREEFQRSKELRDRERLFKRKDGSSLEVSLSVTAVQDGEGRLQGKAVWRDISARKRAERDRRFVAELSDVLRLSPNAFDLMVTVAERVGLHLSVARASFIEVDVHHDRLTIQADYHPGLPSIAGTFALSGYGSENRAEQQAGKTTVVTDTRIDPRTAAKFETTYEPLGTRSSLAVPLLRDGTWIASLVVTDTKPRVWEDREVALVQSIAERTWLWVEQLRLAAVVRENEAQAIAREKEEHFRILVEGVKDYAILLLDSKGYIKTWNSGAERIQGYGETEIIGKHISVFYTDEDVARGHPEDVLERAAVEGRYAETGWRVRKDGSRFWASMLITPLHDRDGTLQGFAKVTHDESERRQSDEVLRQKQTQLTASLKEREVLLQEVHHRVKNNLQVISSLINMQKRQMVDVEARRGLDECRARVETIAMIHEKLYQSKDYASVPFSDYARSLAANIFHAAGISPANIALKVEIDNVALAVDQAIPCGLILNELISNALKHAFPGERHGAISVELRRLDTSLVLVVGDDGVGMPADFDLGRSKSLGLQLVATLVQQLQAQLEIVRHGGTAFRVTFPWRQAS